MRLYEEGFTQNRELSWLRYDDRVLDEALDLSVPVFERLNFISIFVSNLEEFFQVRVGSLIGDVKEGDDDVDVRSGMTARDQLRAIHEMVPKLIEKKDLIYRIVDIQLGQAGIKHILPQQLTKTETARTGSFFRQKIAGSIKAYIVDDIKKMPRIDEKRPYFICRLATENGDQFGILDVPDDLPKIFVLEPGLTKGRPLKYILVEDIIKMYAGDFFDPFEVAEVACFDIARSAEVELGEGSDQLEEMKKVVKKRRSAPADKLIIDKYAGEQTTDFLMSLFRLKTWQVFRTERISFAFVSELEDVIPFWNLDELCFKPFTPFNQLQLGHGSVIDRVMKAEILSSYPYDSMEPFLELLKEASVDSRVTEIRMTIYRLASQPMIVNYLAAAAANGKKVKVLMELRARFDEEKNIDWAEKLKESGVKVYLGDDKYKVHSKLCQIVLNIDGQKRFISQFGTGNYNEKTAKKYTDLSLITYDQRLGEDANEFFGDVFKEKTGTYKHLLTSPESMHDGLVELIRREAYKGEKGRIFIKCNSVTDEKLIEELMQASCMGCKIRLLVRGICCILPGVKYCTENIQVCNLVGRLLEHSRVYIFGEGKDEVMYISSADMMTRNMQKRVEVACPIYGKENRERIRRIVYLNFTDTVKGRKLLSNGEYSKKLTIYDPLDSQAQLMKESTY